MNPLLSERHPPVLLSGLHPIEWTPPYHVLLSGLHPTPYSYSLLRTVSAMEWTLLLMHSTLPRAIELTPPYPLCCALQPHVFFTANSVSHGVDPLLLMDSTQPCAIEWTPPPPPPPTYSYSLQ